MTLNLPLDIRLSNLTDWLRVRRHVKSNWIPEVREVRKKISMALMDMPECEEIKKLLSHTQITYYQSLEIVDILKKTEQDSKNFRGMYSSQRMKDWKEIVQLYLSDNVYLADAALLLGNLVKFELPLIKKDLIVLEKRISEQTRKADEDSKSAEQQEKLYKEELSRRGLKGVRYLTFELLMSTIPLDNIFIQLNKLIMDLLPAADYYRKTKLKMTPGKTVLPLLTFYFSKGNVSTFEWIYGYAPDETDKFSLDKLLGLEAAKSINQGQNELASQINTLSLEENIDFGSEDKTDGIQLEEESPLKRKPTAQERLKLLENGSTRRELMADINELRFFLAAVEENESKQHPSDFLLSRYIENGVPLLDVWKWTALATQILDIVNDPNTAELMDIRLDPSYLDELVAQIKSHQTKADFFKKNAKVAEKMAEDLKDKYQLVANTYQKVKMESEKLEQRLCKDLGRLTNGRPVHLLSGVKSLP